MKNSKIGITEPFLPPLEEFIPYLTQIWKTKQLTNFGPFHGQLEEALKQYLQVEHISLVANGTMALLMALDVLGITGEVITTPYSFAATTHALQWQGLTPVFADIDPKSLTLDPAKVEAAITERTSAILAVHIYGQPCDVAALRQIADAHGLKLIHDAAHCFGVADAGGSILRHGDLSILSFHATKIFTTLEGGAVVCPDAETKRRIDRLRNFGMDPGSDSVVVEAGINGKLNEVQAAFGLLHLRHVAASIAARRELDSRYRRGLAGVAGITPLEWPPGVAQNHAYFPIMVGPAYGEARDALHGRLEAHGIFARRYFYPLISNMAVYRDLPSADVQNLPVANICADQVLCLPLSEALSDQDLDRIVGLIRH